MVLRSTATSLAFLVLAGLATLALQGCGIGVSCSCDLPDPPVEGIVIAIDSELNRVDIEVLGGSDKPVLDIRLIDGDVELLDTGGTYLFSVWRTERSSLVSSFDDGCCTKAIRNSVDGEKVKPSFPQGVVDAFGRPLVVALFLLAAVVPITAIITAGRRMLGR